MIDSCPYCGGRLVGDGYTTLRRCEFVDGTDFMDVEADHPTIYCNIIKPVDHIEVELVVEKP